jgi:hypothetical protein
MGVGAAAFVVGKGLEAWGTSKSAKAADMRRNELEQTYGRWLPDPDRYQQNWFGDMGRFLPQASRLSRSMGAAEQDAWFANRERALPGFTQGIQGSARGVFDLMQGKMPAEVMSAFQRAGGAGTNGLGFGGSQFGALNTGLFGARGSMGAMQTGFGLLPALLSALPNLQQTSVASILGQGVMNPLQRTQMQLAVRDQNIGVAKTLAGMPSGRDVWGQFISNTGGQISGMGMGMLGGGMGGGGGGGFMGMGGGGTATTTGSTLGAAAAANQAGARNYFNFMGGQ